MENAEVAKGSRKSLSSHFGIAAIVIIIAFTMGGCSNKKSEENIKNKTNAISNPTLWKDVNSGMSFDEVKMMYPSSEIVTIEDLPDNISILQFDGVVVQKEDFLIRFVFDDDKLDAVSLFPKNEITVATSDNLFVGIQEELTLKYGNPVDENSEKINIYYSLKQILWNGPGIIITLDYEKPMFSFNPAFIEIIYTAGTIEKEDNL